MRTIETSYKPSVPSATTQLTIRRLHVYHVTRYLWQNYILSKRVVPSNRSVHVRACRGIFPTVNGRSTWRRTGSSSLSSFLVPLVREIGNKGSELKRRRDERVGTGPLLIRVTEARARRLGHYYADDYRRERERIGSPSPHDLFSRRVKRKVITIADPWITLYVMQALFFLFLSHFGLRSFKTNV